MPIPKKSMEEQHVYHHNVSDGAKINVSFEKNSRGYNHSATVTGASSVTEAVELLKEADVAISKWLKHLQLQHQPVTEPSVEKPV